VLIITCSPSLFNESETIGTLRFGVRAKAIKNKARINKELTVSELKLLLARAEE
jgi:kinesin family protein 5